MKRVFHFCVEHQTGPGQIHVFDGVLTTYKDPFDSSFYEEIKEAICKSMTPNRSKHNTIIRSLTLLATAEIGKAMP